MKLSTEPPFLDPTGQGMLYDKNRRQIEVGDVLKIFHFIGARKKRYYMYKFVLRRSKFGNSKHDYLQVSHLGHDDINNGFLLMCNDEIREDIEIVQGYGANGLHFEDRKKLAK